VDEVSLSEEAPWGAWGSLVTGDPVGYVKVSGCEHPSVRGPLHQEPRHAGGGSYTENLDR
jgi:hypothetical protein